MTLAVILSCATPPEITTYTADRCGQDSDGCWAWLNHQSSLQGESRLEVLEILRSNPDVNVRDAADSALTRVRTNSGGLDGLGTIRANADRSRLTAMYDSWVRFDSSPEWGLIAYSAIRAACVESYACIDAGDARTCADDAPPACYSYDPTQKGCRKNQKDCKQYMVMP